MPRPVKNRDMDMTHGVIWKQLLSFALPMMIGLVFQQLYNTVDSIVVGQFVGKEALAAVGSTSPILNTLVGFSAGLSMGSSVAISQAYGAHDNKRLHDAVHTTIALTFVLSVFMTALGIALVRPLLTMMSTPADVFPEATAYLTIYFAGLIGLLFYNMGSSILRAVGDSRRPLYFLIFSAVLNTVLDLVFVIAFRMGVAGAGYATILAQFISALLVLYVLTGEHTAYGIRWRDVRFEKEAFKKIVAVGLPSGLQQALTSFSNVFVQGYINHFGSAAMAGWSVQNKVDAFLMIPPQAVGMASSTFVGQNFGAQQLARARKGVRQATVMALTMTAAIVAAVLVFSRPLIQLFNTDPEVISYGVRFINIIAPFYLFLTFTQIYAGALRGIGSAKAPMYIMLFSYVLFRQSYLLVVKLLGNALEGVTMAYPVGWIVCTILLVIFYRKSPLSGDKQEA